MTWFYCYIHASDRQEYEAKGWKYWGPGPCLGGWKTVIVRRRA